MSAPRILLAIASLCCALPAAGETQGVRPHVVLISLDTLRADHLSAFGYARETSPRIAALAAHSVVFEEAYSHSQKTAASHMSLMTGLHPEVHGVGNPGNSRVRARLSDQIPTLAEQLRAAGYRTHALHGGGNVSAEYGFDRGFDSYEQDIDLERMLQRARERVAAEAGRDGAPLFLFLHTYKIHGPYTPREEDARRFVDPAYAGRIVSSWKQLAELAPGWPERNRLYWERVDATSAADLRHLSDLYDAGIYYTDGRVGEFLDWLAAQPGWARTLLIVLSDHGEEFGEHGQLRHSTLHRETLHVPLLMRFPGADPALQPRRVKSLARLVDVLPSVLEFARVQAPAQLEGHSLLPVLRGERREPGFVWSQTKRGGAQALRVGDWKLIRSGDGEQLFRVSRDPGERTDLRAQEPARAALLGAQLDALVAAAAARRDALGGAPAEAALDPETARQLEALGYLGEQPAE
jgi:arylsulfatase A-like enzyme